MSDNQEILNNEHMRRSLLSMMLNKMIDHEGLLELHELDRQLLGVDIIGVMYDELFNTGSKIKLLEADKVRLEEALKNEQIKTLHYMGETNIRNNMLAELEKKLEDEKHFHKAYYDKGLEYLAKVNELEKKLEEANKELELKHTWVKHHQKVVEIKLEQNAKLEKKLALAVEALEFICTYKSPDYMTVERGSVFSVARSALKQLSEQ